MRFAWYAERKFVLQAPQRARAAACCAMRAALRVHHFHLLGEEGLRGQRERLGDECRIAVAAARSSRASMKACGRDAALLEDDRAREPLPRLPAVEGVVVVRHQVRAARPRCRGSSGSPAPRSRAAATGPGFDAFSKVSVCSRSLSDSTSSCSPIFTANGNVERRVHRLLHVQRKKLPFFVARRRSRAPACPATSYQRLNCARSTPEASCIACTKSSQVTAWPSWRWK